MNELMLHRGSRPVPIEAVEAVPTPPSTATWTPIPHIELLRAIRTEMLASGLQIAKETYALSQAQSGKFGDRFFGLLDIRGDGQPFNITIGIRNSHDCSYPAGLCVGSHVLVCDNLSFLAEVVIARKHTRRIREDLPRLIHDAVGRLGDLRLRQEQRIEAYQATTLPDPQFHDLAVRALDAQVLCASKIPRVLDLYRRPPHPQFEPRSVWSGFNAFTEVLKLYDLQDLPRRTRLLHGLCDLLCQLN